MDGSRRGRRILLFRARRCQGIAGVLLALSLAGCAGRAAAVSVPAAGEEAGTIRKVGAFGYAIVPDRDPGTRYAPERPLPPNLQVDGLRVLFTGSVGTAPEGARQWGTPYRLDTIRRVVD